MLPDSLSIRRTDKIVYQPESTLLLLSVPHTGTRYTERVLEGFGCTVETHHVSEPNLLKSPFREMPAVVPLRDPYLCFLSWWKDEIDADAENKSSLGCLALWSSLDYILYMRRISGAKTILWRVDSDPEEALADRLGVIYTKVDAAKWSHHITDQYIQPVRDQFPDDLKSIAARWGY